MGINPKLQNSKMQIKYFVNTDRKFQHTLTQNSETEGNPTTKPRQAETV